MTPAGSDGAAPSPRSPDPLRLADPRSSVAILPRSSRFRPPPGPCRLRRPPLLPGAIRSHPRVRPCSRRDRCTIRAMTPQTPAQKALGTARWARTMPTWVTAVGAP